jgi:general transcription factor 3C polypeptide 3 (transcription factor C subunit 4)
MVSNAYQARERQDCIRLATIIEHHSPWLFALSDLIVISALACGLAAGQHAAVVEQACNLITVHQFNEPLRILMACLSSGFRLLDTFFTSTLQKRLLREMKLADTAVKSTEVLNWDPLNKWYLPTAQSVKVEEGLRRMDKGVSTWAIASISRAMAASVG